MIIQQQQQNDDDDDDAEEGTLLSTPTVCPGGPMVTWLVDA